MSQLLLSRIKKLSTRKSNLERLYLADDDVSSMIQKYKVEKYVVDSKQYYAAARIQGIIRGYLDRLLVKDLLFERRAIIVIQKVIRGKLGRIKWMKEYWKTKSVVKSDAALLELIDRSRLVRQKNKYGKGPSRGYNWCEMFDSATNSYWYINKKNNFSCWDCPYPLQDNLICTWDGYEAYGGLPSEGPCRMMFDNVSTYYTHMETCHKWYCLSCDHCNYGITFPTCSLCNCKGNGSGDQDELKKLEDSIAAVKNKLSSFITKETSNLSPNNCYNVKSRFIKLANRKINADATAAAAADATIVTGINLDLIEFKKNATIKASGGSISSVSKNKSQSDVVSILSSTSTPATIEQSKAAVTGRNTTASIAASNKPGISTARSISPLKPGFEAAPEDGIVMVGTVKNASDLKLYKENIGIKEKQQARYADPIDLGVFPVTLFNEVMDETLEKVKSSVNKSLNGGDTSLLDDSDGDDNDTSDVTSTGGGGGGKSIGTHTTASSSTWQISLDESKLLVCQKFLKNKCSRTTCPLAHPGVRDDANIVWVKLPNRAKKVATVTLCNDYNIYNSSNIDECPNGKRCKYYHVYIRPSTQEIISRIYPKESGKGKKLFLSGAALEGWNQKSNYNGPGVMTWQNGSTYVGDFKNNRRHGFGVYRSNVGDEYVGNWIDGKRSGMGVLHNSNDEEYIGEWRDGKMHGAGQLKGGNGDMYIGTFQNHKYHGIGTFTKGNGDKYVGHVIDGMATGLGILMHYNGDRYKGYFDRNYKHGKGVMSYKNGCRYAGNWYRSAPTGFGVFVSKAGEKAIGDWSNGKKHGNCRYYFSNGDFYDGEFHKDVAKGHGCYYHLNGNMYIGEWSNNMRNGRGTYAFANGSKYTGNWVDNAMHGKGKYDYANDCHYRGEFERNRRHGRGIYTWSNQNIYKGDFTNDQINGKGEMTYVMGHRYIGDWLNNKKHGIGRFYYNSGHMYDGHWVDDIRHGKGKMTFLIGTVIEESYEGNWFNDEKHGIGKYTYRADEGSVYEGEWCTGVRQGVGKLSYADGCYYRGEFKNEYMWGRGVYVGSDGTQYDGEWRMNMRQGVGTTIGTDGSIYHGEFWQNMKHGAGMLYNPDGSIYQGTWQGNVIVGAGKYKIVCGVGSHKDGPEEVTVKVFGY